MDITILGHQIEGKDNDYYSLTDIAKAYSDRKPNQVVRSWLRNNQTVLFLEAWERLHNPNFKGGHFDIFRLAVQDNSRDISAKKYMDFGIGITATSGRYGGIFAHIEIALDFAAWINPNFKVYMFKTWVEMKTQQDGSLSWHIEKIERNIEEIQILLDTVPRK